MSRLSNSLALGDYNSEQLEAISLAIDANDYVRLEGFALLTSSSSYCELSRLDAVLNVSWFRRCPSEDNDIVADLSRDSAIVVVSLASNPNLLLSMLISVRYGNSVALILATTMSLSLCM